jgi:hypothetical protein
MCIRLDHCRFTRFHHLSLRSLPDWPDTCHNHDNGPSSQTTIYTICKSENFRKLLLCENIVVNHFRSSKTKTGPQTPD